MAGYAWSFNFLVSDEGSESLEGMFVSTDFFKVLGLEPLLGRTFQESETAFPAGQVIVLGYDVWQRKFGGDPKIIGTPVRISRRQTPPTVIGVMPPGIRFLPSPTTAQEPNYNVNAQVDFWMPAAPNPERLKQPNWDVVGRLRNGATIDQARAELTVLTSRQAQADKDFEGITAQANALTDDFNRDAGRILLPLVRRGSAGAVDRVRKRRRPAARARSAASGRVRRPHRARRQTARALPSGLGRKPADRPARQRARCRSCVRDHQGVQADCRTSHPAAGRGDRGLAGAGVGAWPRHPGCARRRAFCRPFAHRGSTRCR